MEVNNPEVLDKFMSRHRRTKDAILRWLGRVGRSRWRMPHGVRLQTSDVSILRGGRLVFDIMGNDYRLVAEVDYEAGTLDVCFIGTHAQYDKIDAEEVRS